MSRWLRRALACLGLVAMPLWAASCKPDAPRPAPAAAGSDAALATIERALRRFQVAPPALRGSDDPRLALAREHLGAERWEAARGVLERLLDGEGGADGARADEARLLLGIAHQEAHRPALALPLLEAVLERGPSFASAPQAFYFYGKALADAGRAQAARAAFEADRALFPASGDAWFQLALLDVEEGDDGGARTKLERALELFTTARDKARAQARLGDLALGRDDLAEAERRYLACVELFPHYEVFHKLATVARRRGDGAAAEAYQRRHEELRAAARPLAPGPR